VKQKIGRQRLEFRHEGKRPILAVRDANSPLRCRKTERIKLRDVEHAQREYFMSQTSTRRSSFSTELGAFPEQ